MQRVHSSRDLVVHRTYPYYTRCKRDLTKVFTMSQGISHFKDMPADAKIGVLACSGEHDHVNDSATNLQTEY